MQIAVFKPKAHTDEGELVWDKLRQKVVFKDELAEHLADGWIESAAEALLVTDVAEVQKDNEQLQAEIDAAQVKLDLRTKAGREAKAKLAAENESA